MTQKYKVGDKVRILDASKIISGASRGLKDGGIYEVVELYKGREYDPIVKLDDGLKFGFMDDDYNYIEKVAEDVPKFKVGDKVRIISTEGQPLRGFKDGDIVTITDAYKNVGEQRYEVSNSNGNIGYGGNTTFELVSDKPTKNQRIKTLESEVAELKAKVEALEKAQKQSAVKAVVDGIHQSIVKAAENSPLFKSPNEQRKAIIAEAKAFVEDAKNFTGSLSGRKGYKYASTDRIVCDVEFIVNTEKHTVVALLKYQYGGHVAAKGIAKCAPDDVFNADIGKAIALGRALGLDVGKFEQAVKPTEVVVGHVVQIYSYSGRAFEPAKITKIDDCDGSIRAEGLGRSFYEPEKTNDRIKDDTEAQY